MPKISRGRSSVGADAWMPGLLATVAGVVIAASTSSGPWLRVAATSEPVTATLALHGMDATRTLLAWIGIAAAIVGVARLLRAGNKALWSTLAAAGATVFVLCLLVVDALDDFAALAGDAYTELTWRPTVLSLAAVALVVAGLWGRLSEPKPFDWWVSQRDERRADGAQL